MFFWPPPVPAQKSTLSGVGDNWSQPCFCPPELWLEVIPALSRSQLELWPAWSGKSFLGVIPDPVWGTRRNARPPFGYILWRTGKLKTQPGSGLKNLLLVKRLNFRNGQGIPDPFFFYFVFLEFLSFRNGLRKCQFMNISKRVIWSKMLIVEHVKTCGLVEHVNFWASQNVWFGRKC